jgi:cystathionine beta-lyase/cystathionine gamma-synthase
VSRFLHGHRHVKRVHFPGLDSHPQHELAKRQMKDFGSIVSFELDGGYEEGNRFAEALQFFSITSSVGSTESLVMPPQLLGGQEYTAAQRETSLIGRGTVRLSIGIEDPPDLIADLDQALAKACIPPPKPA